MATQTNMTTSGDGDIHPALQSIVASAKMPNNLDHILYLDATDLTWDEAMGVDDLDMYIWASTAPPSGEVISQGKPPGRLVEMGPTLTTTLYPRYQSEIPGKLDQLLSLLPPLSSIQDFSGKRMTQDIGSITMPRPFDEKVRPIRRDQIVDHDADAVSTSTLRKSFLIL